MSKLHSALAVLATLVVVAALPGDRSMAKKAPPTTSVTGPFFPSWSQTLTGTARFKSVLGGAAVLDNETGLVWQTTPDPNELDVASWSDAHVFCNTLSAGNRMGWRLPAVQELASLLDPSVVTDGSTPALPSGNPFSGVEPNTLYWTAIGTVDGTFAWVVGFDFAEIFESDVGGPNSVWCVRSGAGTDLQG